MTSAKIFQTLRSLAGLPCRECGGKGYVVDADVAKFIEQNGLARYQAADTLMVNEIHYGGLGSINIGAWEDLGLPEDQAELFATDVAHVHKLHACRACNGQKDHPDALKAATDVIKALQANDRRRYAEWAEGLTPQQHREHRRSRMRNRMDIAIRYAQQPPLDYSKPGKEP